MRLGTVQSLASWMALAALGVALGCGSGSSTEPGFEPISSAGSGGNAGAGGTTTTTTSSTTTSSGTQPEKLGPPYPIVLAHGFFGFDTFAGLDFAAYYYHVKSHLADEGEELVFTPDVDPFNSSEVRGAQLLTKIEDILITTGHAKVNIVGHSQGGLDARVVAHERPDLVASVLTLQAPHFGTPIADIALKVLDDPHLQEVLDFLLQAVGQPLYDEIGDETSLYKPMVDFSEQGIAEFNAKYFDRAGVYYASIAGRSDLHPGGSACIAPASPPFIAAWKDELDPIDPMFDITEMILDGGIGDPFPNDGLVRVVDAQWGEFLGCLPADHLDMVGHLFGDAPGIGNDWDYRQFYVDLVAFIRSRGF